MVRVLSNFNFFFSCSCLWTAPKIYQRMWVLSSGKGFSRCKMEKNPNSIRSSGWKLYFLATFSAKDRILKTKALMQLQRSKNWLHCICCEDLPVWEDLNDTILINILLMKMLCKKWKPLNLALYLILCFYFIHSPFHDHDNQNGQVHEIA